MSYTHIHTYIYVYMERGVEGVGERGVRERGEGEREIEKLDFICNPISVLGIEWRKHMLMFIF